jgi:VanZ family protein
MSAWLGRHRAAARWLPALAWMTVIFLLSSQSGLRVTEDAAVDRPIRVLAHMATYAFLAALVLYALKGWDPPSLRSAVVALVLTAAYAVSDELHQALVPDRTGRAADVVVDVIGAIVGLLIAVLIVRSRERLRSGPRAGKDEAAG